MAARRRSPPPVADLITPHQGSSRRALLTRKAAHRLGCGHLVEIGQIAPGVDLVVALGRAKRTGCLLLASRAARVPAVFPSLSRCQGYIRSLGLVKATGGAHPGLGQGPHACFGHTAERLYQAGAAAGEHYHRALGFRRRSGAVFRQRAEARQLRRPTPGSVAELTHAFNGKHSSAFGCRALIRQEKIISVPSRLRASIRLWIWRVRAARSRSRSALRGGRLPATGDKPGRWPLRTSARRCRGPAIDGRADPGASDRGSARCIAVCTRAPIAPGIACRLLRGHPLGIAGGAARCRGQARGDARS